MGYHIGESIQEFTENLTYIVGGAEEKYSYIPGARNIKIDTTEEMLDAILGELEENSLLIMAAAPADYRPANPKDRKIKKSEENSGLVLELTENPDILKAVNDRKKSLGLKNFYALGFAAETDSLELNAKKKLISKGLDWIAGNQVGRGIGFGEVDSELILYGKDGSKKTIGPGSKEILAKQLVAEILDILSHQ
jgi:phosphopantothenoylcysteine decarboxylase/phosphopantothenate--cysteine ligase